MRRFSNYQLKRDIIRTFQISLLLSLCVFGWLRILFIDFPFSIADEAKDLLKTIATYWLIILGLKMSINFGLVVFDRFRRPGFFNFSSLTSRRMAILLLSISALFSCNLPPTGIKKDFSTGLVTKYSGLVPREVNMVMNGEELKHTDIPLGESFTIINKNINGFTIKEGKVSVGCSLKITDTAGRELLNEADLFADNPIFQPDSAKTLQCEVNTGKPMDWDQKYAVKVIFWDKFGTGKIENAMQISMIDKP